MSETYDAIVVGGGPAGSASAISLKKKFSSVLLIEKSFFPRDKVCGEFISPAAWKVFDGLGLRDEIMKSSYCPIDKAILHSPKGHKAQICFYSNHALGLSRKSLDSILINHVKSLGVDVLEGFLMTHYEKDADGCWKVSVFSKDSKIVQYYKAKHLIMAKGRSSSVAPKKKMIGLKAHYQGIERSQNILDLYLFREGYGGLVQVEDQTTNACFLVDMKKIPLPFLPRNPDQVMDFIFSCHPILKKQMTSSKRVSNVQVTGPSSFGLQYYSDSDEVFHVGDALGVIDPFLGDGMTMAMEAGSLVGNSENARHFSRVIKEKFSSRFRWSQWLRLFHFHPWVMDQSISFLSSHEKLTQNLFERTHGYIA